MTVQGVNESNNSGWMLPVGGALVGGAVGGYMTPKYKSFEDLVEAASKDDKFEIKAPDNATDEVKGHYNTVKTAVDKEKDVQKAVAELFPEGTTEVKAEDVLKKLNKAVPEKVAEKEQMKALGELFANVEADKELSITDDMKALFKDADGKVVADAETKVKTLLKEMGADLTGDTKKVTADMKNAVKAKADGAAKYLTENQAAIDFMKGATGEGKVGKEAVETFAKNSVDDAVKTAFDNIKGSFGKNWLKGAGIWGVVGLAAGWIISKFVGGSKEA